MPRSRPGPLTLRVNGRAAGGNLARVLAAPPTGSWIPLPGAVLALLYPGQY